MRVLALYATQHFLSITFGHKTGLTHKVTLLLKEWNFLLSPSSFLLQASASYLKLIFKINIRGRFKNRLELIIFLASLDFDFHVIALKELLGMPDE